MVCSPAKRNDIQLLRGVSVLLVLLFHLEMQGFENGYLGVDIFFVLSGFLMGSLYNRYSPIEFYRRRIERIAPAYFAVILISCSFCFFLANLSDFSQFFEQALANSIFLGNVYFWSNASYFNKQYFYPLLHLWSLSIEVQFYILVPILFPVFAKYRYVLLLFALSSAMLALIVVSFSPKTAFFLLPFRLWEFLLGAFVGLASLQQSTKKKQNLITDRLSLSLLFLVVLLIASLDIRPAANSFLLGHPSLLTMIIPVLVSLILFLGVSEKCIANNIVFSTLSRLGNASYSLYLVHFPIIVFFNYEPFGGTILKTDSITALLIQIVIIGVATLICYLVFEKNRSVKIASLLLPVGFICVSALFLFLAKAMKFEITEPNQRVVASAWLDRGTYRCGKISRLSWIENDRNVDIFDVKKDVIQTLIEAGYDRSKIQIDDITPNYYHPGKSGRIFLNKDKDKIAGYFGEIHPNIIKKIDIKTEALVGFEIFVDNLKKPQKLLKDQKKLYQVSDFQKSERDFAFIVNKDVNAQDLINSISSIDKSLVKDVRVFDVYQGDNIPENQKSIAISVTIQSSEKTLNEADLELINNLIIKTVENKTGAKIRS